MKTAPNFTNKIVAIISYLFVFLFTYAALSKLLDFENFQIQLGQSPLISAFAGYVAVAVPLFELIIVLLLSWTTWRITGLYFSFVLMIMFSTYIFVILNYSDFIPCSCGGVLDKLNWQQHLVFNLIFACLALLAIIFSTSQDNWLKAMKPFHFVCTMIGTSLAATAIVIMLHLYSEDLIHTENSFIRRFPVHPELEYNKIDLGHNAYYFAGINRDKIYLGSKTATQIATIVDTGFTKKIDYTINLDRPDFQFLSPQIVVNPPHFYVFDGLVPCIFKGEISNWHASFQTDKLNRATIILPKDSNSFIMRNTSLINHSNTLQEFNLMNKTAGNKKFILPAQVDGIFDTDGILLYNEHQNKIQYLYYYRNEYLIFGENMTLVKKGKTIDTVSKAKIKVVKTASGESRMAAPPIKVNKNAATFKNLLFIQSDRVGKFEDDEILKYATIIDVYDTTNNMYLSSFYIYKIGNAKLNSFKIHDNKLYAISGKFLSVIKLNDKIRAALH